MLCLRQLGILERQLVCHVILQKRLIEKSYGTEGVILITDKNQYGFFKDPVDRIEIIHV